MIGPGERLTNEGGTMALINCHECGKEYSSEAPACVHCGAKNASYVKPTSGCLRLFGWGAGGALVVVVLLMMYGARVASTPEGAERIKARDVIDYCEKEAEKARTDPRMSQTAVQIATGACDVLREEYRRKWNRQP
jgi:hypothetical protein